MGTKGRHSAESVLTIKATNVSTNTASATSKAVEVAAKATSGASRRRPEVCSAPILTNGRPIA
jgi:hypothetical protein